MFHRAQRLLGWCRIAGKQKRIGILHQEFVRGGEGLGIRLNSGLRTSGQAQRKKGKEQQEKLYCVFAPGRRVMHGPSPVTLS